MAHDCDVEKLGEVISTKLAAKLEADMDKSIAEYKAMVLANVHTGLKARLDLSKDELTHLSKENQEQALHLLYHRYMDDTLLALLQTAAIIAAVDHMAISSFVHLSAEAYETELSRSVFGKIFQHQQRQQDEQLHEVAKQSTGANN